MASTPRLRKKRAPVVKKLRASIKLNKPLVKKVVLRPVKKSYAALAASEKKYRELVELAHEGITTVAPDETITFTNAQFARSLGYRPEEILGRDLCDFSTKRSGERMREETKKRRRGIRSRYEVEMVHRDGTIKYFWLSVSPIFDKNKKFLGSMGLYSDVTEKKMVERKLEKRVKQINSLYRAYSYARINHSFSSMLNGVAEEAVKAFPYSDFVQSRLFFDGVQYSCPKKLHPFLHKVEFPLIVDGVERGLLEVGYFKKIPNLIDFPSLHEEYELVKNLANILCKHTHAREVMNRYKEIITKAFTAIVIVNKGKIRYANPRFSSLFKTRKRDVLGSSIDSFLPNHDLASNRADGRVKEMSGKRADGSDLLLAVTMLNTFYRGKPSLLIRINDITALKQAQSKLKNFNCKLKSQVREKTRHLEQANKRLRSLNDMKDEFIAITSHELRSPLTSIRGYLSFLTEEDALENLEDPYREYLMRAYTTTDSLNYLINNILDVSRLDMGRFELQIQDVDVLRLVKGVVDSLAFQACENRLEIVFNNQTKDSELIMPIDSIRISQVLRNVLDNSIKFTKRGKKIFVNIIRLKKSVRIVVADQGVGIPKAKLNAVFDKFMQVKNINTKYKGGVGLGLFITKRIVQMHGGKIFADRNEHGGTSISIDLPLISKANGKEQ